MKRAACVVLALLSLTACDGGSAVKEPGPSPTPTAAGDGGGPGGSDGGDAGPGDCFMNPKTHYEIINACTDAVKIEKNPVLPKLLADGGLPPLD